MKLEHLLDIPPTQENPRNSEGSFLLLKNGSVLFIYSHFTQGINDDAAAALWGITFDKNRIPSKPREIIPSGECGAMNLMSLTLLRMKNGDIGLFYLRRIGETRLEMVLRRSEDEGETWSDATPVTSRPGFFVVNNDRVTRLKNGNIIVPTAEHKKMQRADGSVYFDSRSEAVFFVSKDDGITFQEMPGKGVNPYPNKSRSGLQEPGILEMNDGHLWAWARTDLGAQWEMFSFDGGKYWTPPEPSHFTSPLSPMSVLRLHDKRLLAVYNPIPAFNGRNTEAENGWTGGRTPLSISLSEDDGETWSDPVAIESQQDHGYCYTALMEEASGAILLAYCAGGAEDKSCLARLRISRLTLS